MLTRSHDHSAAPPCVRIRRAQREDVPSLLRLACGFDDVVEHLNTWGVAELTSHVERHHQSPTATGCLIAADTSSLVGVATYQVVQLPRWPDPAMLVSRVIVVPSRRRQHIGTRLIQALARQADLTGCGPMMWRVAPNDLIGIRFSERLGARATVGRGDFFLSGDAVRWLVLALEDTDSEPDGLGS